MRYGRIAKVDAVKPIVLRKGVYACRACLVKVAVKAWKERIAGCREAINVKATDASSERFEHLGVELEVVSQVSPGQFVRCRVVRRFYVLDNQAAVVVL